MIYEFDWKTLEVEPEEGKNILICYKNEYIVDEKTVKLLRMFSYVDISKIKELNILPKNKNEINKFLENYYDRYTGIYLKSKDFLTQLREKY